VQINGRLFAHLFWNGGSLLNKRKKLLYAGYACWQAALTGFGEGELCCTEINF
jgi:hypothetical protein